MIGIIPSASRTYEVFGSFSSEDLIEGKLYYDTDNKLYYYSLKEKRPNPKTGYFPVWDGANKYTSNFANNKFFDKDVILISDDAISKAMNKSLAEDIRFRQRRSTSEDFLKPEICQNDNALTQCVKECIRILEITMADLIDMSRPSLDDKQVNMIYNSLSKIAFMRLEKFHVWMSIMLHLKFEIIVYKKNRKILSYKYPENVYDTGIVNYSNIGNKNDDELKKIVKILMVMENITKTQLKVDDTDDYMINNMMTTINSDKPLSSQLFSRFMRLADLNYRIKIYDEKTSKMIFQYKE